MKIERIRQLVDIAKEPYPDDPDLAGYREWIMAHAELDSFCSLPMAGALVEAFDALKSTHGCCKHGDNLSAPCCDAIQRIMDL